MKIGWFVAGIFFAPLPAPLAKTRSSRRKLIGWEQFTLIRARDLSSAYRKAVKEGEEIAKADSLVRGLGFKGGIAFIGLTELVPIRDRIGHLAEIITFKRKGTFSQFRSVVSDLKAFKANLPSPVPRTDKPAILRRKRKKRQ
jgi:hypothetical protein